MADLILHNAEPDLVASLNQQAAALGVSLEDALRLALRRGLEGGEAKAAAEPAPDDDPYAGLDFKEMLMAMPYDGPDDVFERRRDAPRDVSLD